MRRKPRENENATRTLPGESADGAETEQPSKERDAGSDLLH